MTLNDPIGRMRGTSFELTQDWSGRVDGLGSLSLLSGWWGEASIPRPAWSILGISPTAQCVVLAGLIHDWLYCAKIVTRKEVDIIFREVCIACGCHIGDAYAMYYALRLCGSWAWNRITEEEKAEALRLGTLTKGDL